MPKRGKLIAAAVAAVMVSLLGLLEAVVETSLIEHIGALLDVLQGFSDPPKTE